MNNTVEDEYRDIKTSFSLKNGGFDTRNGWDNDLQVFVAPETGIYWISASLTLVHKNRASGSPTSWNHYCRLKILTEGTLVGSYDVPHVMHQAQDRRNESVIPLSVAGAMNLAKGQVCLKSVERSGLQHVWPIFIIPSKDDVFVAANGSFSGFLAEKGFASLMGVDQPMTTPGPTKVGYSDVSTGLLFDSEGGFSNNGYSIPAAGCYAFAAHARFQNDQDVSTFALYVNSVPVRSNSIDHGVHESDTYTYNSMVVSAMQCLEKNDRVEVFASSFNDSAWAVHKESMFTGVMLPTSMGVVGDGVAQTFEATTDKQPLAFQATWSTSAMELDDGFVSPFDGIYHVMITALFDVPSFETHLIVEKDDYSFGVMGDPPNEPKLFSLFVQRTVLLAEGERLGVWALMKEPTMGYSQLAQGGMDVFYIASPGLSKPVGVSFSSGLYSSSWVTPNVHLNCDETFDPGDDLVSDHFVAPTAGAYFFSANVVVIPQSADVVSYFRLYFTRGAVDAAAAPYETPHVIVDVKTYDPTVFSMQTFGVMDLAAGEIVHPNIAVHAGDIGSVSEGTFSGIALDASLCSFYAKMENSLNFYSAGERIVLYDDAAVKYDECNNYDSPSSTYTANVDGLYSFWALLRCDLCNGRFEFSIKVNGQVPKDTTPGVGVAVFDHGNWNAGYNSQQVFATYRLAAGDDVSVTITSFTDTGWTAQRESMWGGFRLPEDLVFVAHGEMQNFTVAGPMICFWEVPPVSTSAVHFATVEGAFTSEGFVAPVSGTYIVTASVSISGIQSDTVAIYFSRPQHLSIPSAIQRNVMGDSSWRPEEQTIVISQVMFLKRGERVHVVVDADVANFAEFTRSGMDAFTVTLMKSTDDHDYWDEQESALFPAQDENALLYPSAGVFQLRASAVRSSFPFRANGESGWVSLPFSCTGYDGTYAIGHVEVNNGTCWTIPYRGIYFVSYSVDVGSASSLGKVTSGMGIMGTSSHRLLEQSTCTFTTMQETLTQSASVSLAPGDCLGVFLFLEEDGIEVIRGTMEVHLMRLLDPEYL